MYVYVLSPVSLFVTSWTVAGQAPLSMEFSRQEYCSGLSFPPPGDLPDPGLEYLALAGRFFTSVALGKPLSALSFPCGSAGKESTHNVGRPGFNSWIGIITWRRDRL